MYVAAGQACRNGDVRLQDGEEESVGRVEVCLGGEWTTYCGYQWDNRDAQVVCRQLGFSNPQGESTGMKYANSNVVIDQSHCTNSMFLLNAMELDCL